MSGTPSISQILPFLFLSNVWTTFHPDQLQANHITAVVSLADAPKALWNQPKFTDHIIHHMFIPALDSSTQDLLPYMESACEWIDSVAQPTPSSAVLVHCQQGISRSATIVLAYLMRKEHKSCNAALEEVKAHRPQVQPNPNFMEQLAVWEQTGYQIWEDKEKKTPKKPYQDYLDRRAEQLKAKGLTGNEPTWPIF